MNIGTKTPELELIEDPHGPRAFAFAKGDNPCIEAARLREVARWLDQEADRMSRTAGQEHCPAPSHDVVDRQGYLQRANMIYMVRRHRDRIFGDGLFGEPSWDIMLELFINFLSKKTVSVSSLCLAAAAPTTTALRYINKLVDADLIIRSPDQHDHRKTMVKLSTRGLLLMARFFADGTITNLSPLRWPRMAETSGRTNIRIDG